MQEVISKKYIAYTKAPIHIGSHREQVGDNSTVRDVDGFPFIPASSLKGSVRSHCSTYYGVEGCDGKGWYCPQPHKCASCAVFGYANYHQGNTASSLVKFSSASLIMVPIPSDHGTFWLTSRERLYESGIVRAFPNFHINDWLVGEQIRQYHVASLGEILTDKMQPTIKSVPTLDWFGPQELRNLYPRIIVVDELNLSSISNHFTGLSTSVAIDGKTGQARSGALFAVEHINQKSVLAFEVTYINPATRGIYELINTKGAKNESLPASINLVSEIVGYGLKKLEFYGIGGKRSRGFGNLLIWNQVTEKDLQSTTDYLVDSKEHDLPHVFISYTSKDITVARRLAADLQAEQFDVWLDEHKILVGDSIHRKIEEGITECDFLILLVSNESLQSAWVQEEVNAVKSREKAHGQVILMPAILEDIPNGQLPLLLRDRKYATFHKSYNEGLRELVESLHRRSKLSS